MSRRGHGHPNHAIVEYHLTQEEVGAFGLGGGGGGEGGGTGGGELLVLSGGAWVTATPEVLVSSAWADAGFFTIAEGTWG